MVPVKLVPSKAELDSLVGTLRACNAAAEFVSGVAFDRRIWSKFSLHKVTYGDVRARFGLPSQMAIRVIHKVTDAYNSGKVEHRRGAARRRFRWQSAQPFDARNLSINAAAKTVSISTIGGRLKAVKFACSDQQLAMIAQTTKIGESDLVYSNGAVYLYVTVEVPEAVSNMALNGFIGVDLGIVNIASTSDGQMFSGAHLNHVRNRNLRLRRKLQKKGTPSARRLLRKRSGRENRFATDVNHCISKKLVTEAKRTGRGIALEDLEGIRDRARFRKPQRVMLHSWSFAQLGAFTRYKGRRDGVPVVFVDPRYTSQQCSHCGHIDRKNRKNQASFACTGCGFVDHADLNAALNIASRGVQSWAVSHAATREPGLAA